MFNNKANYIKHILLMLIMENIKQIYKYYLFTFSSIYWIKISFCSEFITLFFNIIKNNIEGK